MVTSYEIVIKPILDELLVGRSMVDGGGKKYPPPIDIALLVSLGENRLARL